MYIQRKLEETILRYLPSPEIIAIAGPRQAGKTTTVLKIMGRLSNSSTISFEDQRVLGMFEHDIDAFVELYVKGKSTLFIDEFQYAKHGGKTLKYLYDRYKIKMIISGSSAIDLTVRALKFLVGRIFVFQLFPLDFEEYLSYKSKECEAMLAIYRDACNAVRPLSVGADVHAEFLRYYDEYILYGGYPRVVLAQSIEEKKQVLRNISNTYFLREVRDVLGLIDDYKLSNLIKGLALQTGNTIEYAELSTLSEFPFPTLKKYLNFLEQTFICTRVRPYFRNRRTEIVKNPKVYFFDTGLRNVIVDDFRSLSDRPDGGALLENGLVQDFIKRGIPLKYWRDKKKNEVDLVLERGNGQRIAIEVKMARSSALDFSAQSFQKKYPDIPLIQAYRRQSREHSNSSFLAYPAYAI